MGRRLLVVFRGLFAGGVLHDAVDEEEGNRGLIANAGFNRAGS